MDPSQLPERLPRYRAFLERAPTDRALLGCQLGLFMNASFPDLVASLPEGVVSPDDLRTDLFARDLDRLADSYGQVDDDYPFVGGPFPYFPWMEAIMGSPVYASSTSMWAGPVIEDWDAWLQEPPEIDRNAWARRLVEWMRVAAERAGGRFPVAPTLMRGPLDMLSALRSPELLALDLFDHPEAVRRAARLCADVWIAMGKAQLALVPDCTSGYVAGCFGLRVWGPDRVIWLQEDAAELLGPDFYREFFSQEDGRIAGEFPWVAFHTHGTALCLVDELLALREVDVVQLSLDGVPSLDVEGVFQAWKKIQRRKPLVVWMNAADLGFWPSFDRVLEELDPAGLSIQVVVSSLEEARAVTEHHHKQGLRANPRRG